MVADPTVIVHVTLETTSPEAAVASCGCVGEGDADGLPVGDALSVGDALPAVGVASAEADVAGVPVGPTVGVGPVDDAVPEGTAADAVGDGAADEAGADELGLGLGLELGEGRQKMIRMQLWSVDCPACGAASARPPVNATSPATSMGTAASAAKRLMTVRPRFAILWPGLTRPESMRTRGRRRRWPGACRGTARRGSKRGRKRCQARSPRCCRRSCAWG